METGGPQDIEFVASLGDSITAGTGALASNLLEVLDENRGSTYFTGGDGDWRSCPSIYNFIKSYNYKVKGGASGSTRVFEIPFKRKGFGERGLARDGASARQERSYQFSTQKYSSENLQIQKF